MTRDELVAGRAERGDRASDDVRPAPAGSHLDCAEVGDELKAVKITSVSVLLIFTAAAVAVALAVAAGAPSVPFLAAMEPPLRLLLICVTVAVVTAAILLPLGVALERSVGRLRCEVEDARELAASSRAQVRDLEIRRQVSETERRRVEAVLHTLRHPVVVTDAYDEIVLANDAAAELLGFETATAVHRSIHEVIGDQRLCQLISDARGGAFGDCRHVEHRLFGPSCDPSDACIYDVVLSCVADHKNEVGGIVTVLHDLTRERERLEMRSDFVSTAIHELRTPLSAMRAYVEMLVDGEATDEESRLGFYRIIQDETERLARLIDDMLNISRIEAGVVRIDRESIDLRSLVERAAATLEPNARHEGIEMDVHLASSSLCVEGDSDMLYQVVLNVLSNGIKYTPEGGRVTLIADSDNVTGSVLVTVTDTGLGIPQESMSRLFDKFYRIENYKHVAKGTGLGLSLCKHVVETVHHGRIGVESKLGVGSRFWFSIPKRYEVSRGPQREEAGDMPRILVVDDEAHIVQVLTLKLRNAGFEVDAALDGEEAIEIALKHRPDLVVTDFQMPYMTGLELCQALAEEPDLASVPVILLTARGYALDEDDLATGNIQHVLSKPFSPRAIVELVCELLGTAVGGTQDGGGESNSEPE